jgi:methylenetetrahydrofolate dehydrogenase (NADP+) / methenyltetrahydrofolate cyclohydrolase
MATPAARGRQPAAAVCGSMHAQIVSDLSARVALVRWGAAPYTAPMPATRIDGKKLAARVREEVRLAAAELAQATGVVPGLAAVRVGADPASEVYVRNKRRACEKAGMASWEHHLPEATSEAELLDLIERLNADEKVHGILVQLPLPRAIDEARVLAAVAPAKDVDGFHPVSAGHLMTGRPGPRPCTPKGVMRILDDLGTELAGAEVVVVGRSNIVGKPAALLLLERNATVTLCHSRTRDLPGVCRRADVLVVAVGRPEMVRGDWVKEGAVVIDVGINRDDAGKLVGDVAYDEAAERASAITPVPGGVGPLTVAMVLQNTLEAAQRAAGRG